MEDFYETRIDGIDGEIVGLFGVFDGISLMLRVSSCRHIHSKITRPLGIAFQTAFH
jgi:hypothetical protein